MPDVQFHHVVKSLLAYISEDRKCINAYGSTPQRSLLEFHEEAAEFTYRRAEEAFNAYIDQRIEAAMERRSAASTPREEA